MFTDLKITVGGITIIAQNYRSTILLEHGVALRLAQDGGKVTMDMLPTFLSAVYARLERERFSSLSNRLKLEAVKAWVEASRDSVVYKPQTVGEEPNVVY